jgi:hypothetical protein
MMTDREEQTIGPDQTSPGPVRSWPLVFLAAPAFVAIWSGWVGLGELAGFGVVHPLPGIWDDLKLNTAITLPIGVEAYAAYALRAWLSGAPAPTRARVFAKRSAIGALVLGALGQVAYHLLAAADVPTAPWWITTLVACLPVAVLGMGAALAHLLRAEPDRTTTAPPDRIGQHQPAVEQTGPAPIAAPGRSESVEQAARSDRTAAMAEQTEESDRTVVSIAEGHRTGPAAVRNALALADRYPDHIPPQKTVERELGWGAERTRKALTALAEMRQTG